MTINYYTSDINKQEISKCIYSGNIRFKRFNVGDSVIIRLGNVKLNVPKTESIQFIGMVHEMFNTKECILEYRLKDFHIDRYNYQSVTLKEQYIKLPNKYIKG